MLTADEITPPTSGPPAASAVSVELPESAGYRVK